MPPNKESFKVKSEFKSCDLVSNSYIIKKFIILGGVKVVLIFFFFLSSLLQILNKNLNFRHVTDGERFLLVVKAVVSSAADKSLDFHDTIF